MKAKHIFMVAFTTLLLCSATAFAGPTFESATFGKQSTHCDTKSTRISIVPDGSGISISFDKMQAQAGTKMRSQDHRRCDMTLKLAVPLEAPAVIQIDVRGDARLTGKGAASATVTYLGRTEPVHFQWKDDDGFDRINAQLPKGAQQLDLSFKASAKGEFPDSTALIAIDSLDIVFQRKH